MGRRVGGVWVGWIGNGVDELARRLDRLGRWMGYGLCRRLGDCG